MKIITVRGTAFDAAAASGGSGSSEAGQFFTPLRKHAHVINRVFKVVKNKKNQ